uniref:Ig-like domain-containing protein n=1 Tax=Labrus bergylta TaxID=56723 RepID=A0A3Q3FQ52_9LABR
MLLSLMPALFGCAASLPRQSDPANRRCLCSEGDTVTLDCKVETISTTLYLFWYRQEMGDFPKYLWKGYAGLSQNALGISEDRFNKRVNLEISSAALTDSAVYYCALQPTVTGNTTTLYKTSGEKTILHNIHKRESLTINWNQSGG